MTAVGQKHGKAGCTVGRGYIRRYAAGGRYSLNGTPNGRKDDHIVAIPRCSPALSRVTQRLRRAATGGDLLELALREESDLVAVGRPEWVRSVVSTGHRLSLK